MYSYTHDPQTGGILLNTSPTGVSKEPRPVYAAELDVLGFDKLWNYDIQTEVPYMWAESNHYIYRGKTVAHLKGGNIYTAPEVIIPTGEDGQPVQPEPNGKPLQKIDIQTMVEKNHELMDIIEQSTVKKILAVYTKYKMRLDSFHVAFSGGKDSCVLLDLVKKALPKNSFIVVFGDTGMEFPDTYDLVAKTRLQCAEEGIPFYVAKSHLDPMESWKLFGPPSRVLRWCCSVHKSAPQTLRLRSISQKNDYVGLDFVGVRANESIARSNYKYENYGKKQRGQYSHNSILEWSSAEIWLYIFSNSLPFNITYKRGNSRAGCLFCPMSGGSGDFVRRMSYPSQIDTFIHLIKTSYDANGIEENSPTSYVLNGGWNVRKNGRELLNNPSKYSEKVNGHVFEIRVTNPSSDWREWIKTLGDLSEEDNSFRVIVDDDLIINFSIKKNSDGYTVFSLEEALRNNPSIGKLYKQVFRKAAYCGGCRVCEVNCRFGCISFREGKVRIQGCIRCHECHNIDSGCLMYHSLRHPQGGGKTMKSLNSFADHAPKKEWLKAFFDNKNEFFTSHSLGPMMFDMFRRFLKDAELSFKNQVTPFAELVCDIGWNSDVSQGLILTNLVNNNPQMEWYTRILSPNRVYPRELIESLLISTDVKPKDAKSIIKAYERLVDTPLGPTLNWGEITEVGDLLRKECHLSDSKILLYSLFKFAEKCNGYKEFTLSTLMNDSIERDGISPTRIFGLSREKTIPMLIGLSAKYPDFITTSFTHDLEKITLAEDKNSQDVLDLFRGE